MVPETLGFTHFTDHMETKKMLELKSILPIGLEYEYASPVGVSLEQHNLAIIMPTVELVQQIITNSSHLLVKKELRELVVFDTPSMELMKLKELPLTYITNSERIEGKIDILYGAFKTAEQAYLEELQSNNTITKEEYFKNVPPIVVVTYSTVQLYNQLSSNAQKQLLEMLKSDGKMGVQFIIGNDLGSMAKEYSPIGDAIRNSKQVLLGARFADQAIYSPTIRIVQEKPLAPQELYLLLEGNAEKLKIPKG